MSSLYWATAITGYWHLHCYVYALLWETRSNKKTRGREPDSCLKLLIGYFQSDALFCAACMRLAPNSVSPPQLTAPRLFSMGEAPETKGLWILHFQRQFTT